MEYIDVITRKHYILPKREKYLKRNKTLLIQTNEQGLPIWSYLAEYIIEELPKDFIKFWIINTGGRNSYIRYMIFYIMYYIMGLKTQEIANAFGLNTHGAVISGLKKFNQILDSKKYTKETEILKKIIKKWKDKDLKN